MRGSPWLNALGLVGTVLVAAPEAFPPRSAVTQPPVFRSGADYVRVDVVATGRDDKPIVDLTKDDFEILDRGRRQTIDTFQLVSVPVARRAISATDTAVPNDVATNAPPAPNSRLFVMIVDDLHIVESDIPAVKKVMTAFVEALSPADEAAVVFVEHSNLSQNVTTDRVALMRTVDHLRDALGFGLDALGRPNASNLARPDPHMLVAYARESDIVLKSVAEALGGSEHVRRAIVYVTDGSIVPTSPKAGDLTDFEWLQEAYDAARRADVPIYTIDPRGQPLPEDAVRGGIGAIGGYGLGPGPNLRERIAANIVAQENRLAEVAINTGGRAFTRQSNLERAIDEIVGDNGSLYVLGYYPTPFEPDGNFHPIAVHVNRPGVRVRARAGYIAAGATPSSDSTSVLDAALSAGVDVSSLPLRAVAAPLAAGAKGVRTVVTVEVGYPAPASASGRIDDDLRIHIVAVDPDGKVKASSERAVHFSRAIPAASPVTFVSHEVLDLPPQPLTLRVGVASRALVRAGMVQMSVTAPKLSSGKLQLSGIVLGFGGPPHDPPMLGDALANLVPFQPTTTRVFGSKDALRVYARAFWDGPQSNAEAIVTVTGTTTLPPQIRTIPASSTRTNRHEAVIDATLPLSGLSPGKYLVSMQVRLANGQTTRNAVPFEVR